MVTLLLSASTLGRTSLGDPNAELGRELAPLSAPRQCYAIADRVGDPVDLHASRELVQNLLRLALRKLAQNIAQDLDLAGADPIWKFEVTTTTGIPRRLTSGGSWRVP
jgi:hypothetical protein